MKIHTCREGWYVMTVLDMHTGLAASPELPTLSAVRTWMTQEDPECEFYIMDAEWAEMAAAVEEYGYVRAQTEYDTDVILCKGGK
jgi:hypothetical protein